MAEQPGERVADTDGDKGRNERQESGEQGTKGDAEHDERQHDPRSSARRTALCFSVLDVLAAERHLQVSITGRLCRPDHMSHRRLGHVLALGGEGHGGEGHLTVLAYLSRSGRTERAGDRAYIGQMRHLVEHLRRPGLQRAAPEGARRGIQDNLVRAARGGGEVLLQQGECLGRLGSRQLELGRKICPGRRTEHERTDQGKQPQRQYHPTMPETKARQTLQSNLLGFRKAKGGVPLWPGVKKSNHTSEARVYRNKRINIEQSTFIGRENLRNGK